MLRAHILGRFEIYGGEAAIALPLRQVQALLAYLLLNSGFAHRRETLAGMFWPEANESNARSNLRHALWRIRKALEAAGENGSQRLETDDLTIRLRLHPADWLDAAALQARVRPDSQVEDLQRQVQAYAGELLPGFYDDWVLLERERLANVYGRKMGCLVEALLRQARWGEASTCAEQWIARGGAPEPAYRALMLAYGAHGNLPGVRAVYQRCQEALQQELGVEPSAPTRTVFDALVRGSPPTQVLAALNLPGSAAMEPECGGASAGGETASPGEISTQEDRRAPLPETPPSAAQSPEPYPSKLPLPLTRFIGRQAELAAVLALFDASKRLLTLTGAGGCGKTRLAIQAAAAAIQPGEPVRPARFSHGAWFVDLAPLTNPGLIASTILNLLGLQEEGDRPAVEVLEGYLRTRELLLVLDNCEHLVADCARLVQRLLQACPHLVVLATSREALEVPGEAVFIVPPMNVPGSPATPGVVDGTAALQSEAVQLFFERAGSPSASEMEAQAPVVAQICRRLDGIPLAIELAAARTRLLSLEQIAARLDDRFRLLAGGSRTALPHQRTLQATLDWSYDLLGQDERRLFRRLSVFSGGWTLEAAEAICAWDGLESWDILDLLAALVNKSLVVTNRTGDQGTRYDLLETMREYASGKLAEAGEQQALAERHLAYWRRWSDQAAVHIQSASQKEWQRHFRVEQDNLRQALHQGLAQDRLADGLWLACNLWNFWEISAQISEGQGWLRRYLEHPLAIYRPEDRAAALARLAWLHSLYHEHELANQCAQASLALQPNGPAAALAYIAMGRVAANTPTDPSNAMHLAEQGLAEAQKAGDRYLEARARSLQGVIWMYKGWRTEALDSFNAAQSLFASLGDQYIAAEGRSFIAALLQDAGELQQARQMAAESTVSARQRGFIWLTGHEGWAALSQGDFAAAQAYFREFTDFWHSLGHYENFNGMIGLITTALYQNQDEEGQRLLTELLDLWDHKPIRPDQRLAWQTFLDINLGLIYILMGDSPTAHRYLDRVPVDELWSYDTSEITLGLARLALLDDDRPAAARQLHTCLQVSIQTTRRTLVTEALEVGAELWMRNGQPKLAARHLGAAHAFRQRSGLLLPPRFAAGIQALKDALCETLGRPAFEQSYQIGLDTLLDQAAQQALNGIESL